MESLTPIWTPSAGRIAGSRLTAFSEYIRTSRAVRAPDYQHLHEWSVRHSPGFWTEVWNFAGIAGDRGLRASIDLDRIPGGRFFPDAMLNFTENLLRRRGDSPAIISSTETGREVTLSHDELRDAVGRAANALRASGIVAGDRIAAIAANTPETVIASLGAAAIGAVWSSCSPDFGVQGILDRFGQIGPRLLLTVDGYTYGGKGFDCLQKAATVAAALPSVKQVVIQSPPRRGWSFDSWRRPLGRLGSRRIAPARLRAASLRSAALHPVFVRNDGRAEVHRPRGRRHAAPAPQGASAALRHPAGRPGVLFHDVRLDDVELAGDRARVGGDAGAVRRFAVPSRRPTACSIWPIVMR